MPSLRSHPGTDTAAQWPVLGLCAGLLGVQRALSLLLLRRGGAGRLVGRAPLRSLDADVSAQLLLGLKLLGDRTQIAGLGVQCDRFATGLLGGFSAGRVDLRGQRGQVGVHLGGHCHVVGCVSA
ncbi:hypothetical protein [Streptomyces fimbriatus]|uniref:Secreted protein n=1 Tax=Streptomyces fimbriatus TaxID=68197 RepID=A0ABW0DDR4_STRFI